MCHVPALPSPSCDSAAESGHVTTCCTVFDKEIYFFAVRAKHLGNAERVIHPSLILLAANL